MFSVVFSIFYQLILKCLMLSPKFVFKSVLSETSINNEIKENVLIIFHIFYSL
jgi:hypothetical protein